MRHGKILSQGFRALFIFCAMLTPALSEVSPYTLDEAFDHGMVGMAARKPDAENAEIFGHLRELDPGIVNGFAFFFGGPSQKNLDALSSMVATIRAQVPSALTVAGWPESILNHYDENPAVRP